jgi:GGDEF domain-containing protein
VIKLAASSILQHCDPKRDFVGHVGGDDFIMLFQSSDWELRCERMVIDFREWAQLLYDDTARAAGGIWAEDRHGTEQFFGFTTLYMGVVPVASRKGFHTAADVASAAAAAKQRAKSLALLVYVERSMPLMPEHSAASGLEARALP